MNKIKDLYGKLYDELECCFKEGKKSEDKELSTFVPMKGFRYDSEEIKLMVVGRATNGWKKEINIDQRNTFIRDAMEKLDNPCRFSWIIEEKQYFQVQNPELVRDSLNMIVANYIQNS